MRSSHSEKVISVFFNFSFYMRLACLLDYNFCMKWDCFDFVTVSHDYFCEDLNVCCDTVCNFYEIRYQIAGLSSAAVIIEQ